MIYYNDLKNSYKCQYLGRKLPEQTPNEAHSEAPRNTTLKYLGSIDHSKG